MRTYTPGDISLISAFKAVNLAETEQQQHAHDLRIENSELFLGRN